MPYQMIYSSRATRPLSQLELEEILDDARSGNRERGVTGALVYADGIFLQILEGERAVLETLMDSISSDLRHTEVKVFHRGGTAARSFRAWHMAYLTPSVEDLASWARLQGTVDIERLVRHVEKNTEHLPRILLSIVKALAAGQTHAPRPG